MVDLEFVIQQNKELRKAADDVRNLSKCVRAYKDDLYDAWRGEESMGLREASNNLSRLLNEISEELYEISHDVMVFGQEIELKNKEDNPKKETEG